MWCPIKWRQMSSCDESAGDYKRAIFGIKLNLSGPKSEIESGPNKPRVSHTMRFLDASFYMSTRKNPGGWRTPIEDSTGDGSNSNGGIVRLGLRSKPLRGSRVNGSVPYISMGSISDALAWQWMDQHENLLEQVWHTRQGTFRRKRPPDVRDDPMRGQ